MDEIGGWIVELREGEMMRGFRGGIMMMTMKMVMVMTVVMVMVMTIILVMLIVTILVRKREGEMMRGS